jgi:MFS family permease
MSASAAEAPTFEARTYAKVAWRILPLLLFGYILAFLDRVNVAFAKLQMAGDLQFSDAVYGFGAGIFFLGYFLFEVPSNLVLRKVGARVWMARIMLTWGVISTCFAFTGMVAWGPISAAFGCTDAEFTFYLLRFLLGVAEAGFFPGAVLYFTYWFPARRRQQIFAIFMAGGPIASLVGGPLSGAILEFMDGLGDLRGWQWLFVVEGLPTIAAGVLFFFLLPSGPRNAPWLKDDERELIETQLAADAQSKAGANEQHSLRGAFGDWRLWTLCVIWILICVPGYAIAFWTPTIVSELGVSPGNFFAVGLLMMGPAATSIVVQILWARNSDLTGERRFHAIGGMLMQAIGLVGLVAIHDAPVLSLIALALAMTGSSCVTVIFWSLPPMFLSGAAAAAGIAFVSSIGSLGGYLGPDLVGRVRAMSGGDETIAMYLMAAALVLASLITLALPLGKQSASEARA